MLVLGSSALLVQEGLSESLAGRFFLHRCSHWPYAECRDAFGWSLPQWLYFGGYPGAAAFIDNETDWKSYITDSLIETVLARDVLHMHKVTKPVLLRHLFALAATLPAQCVSYTKMLGQLHDAGNTTTLAQYLKLLESAFLASGLELFSLGVRRKRGSSPKLLLWNNGLISALSTRRFSEALADTIWWGRLVENAVGAHLCNMLSPVTHTVTYWRDGRDEVDGAFGSLVPVVEGAVADFIVGCAVEDCLRVDGSAFQTGERGDELEGRGGEVGALDGAWHQRVLAVLG